MVRSVRARRSGPLPAALARDLRAASSGADVPCGDLRCGPTTFASLGGRASAEVRLRASAVALRLNVAS